MNIITRRMELYVANEDKSKFWEYLRGLNNKVYRMANEGMTTLHLNENFASLFKHEDSNFKRKIEQVESEIQKLIKEKNKTDIAEEKQKLEKEIKLLYKTITDKKKEMSISFKERFNTTIGNTAYQFWADNYSDIPSYIRSALNNKVRTAYNNERFEVEKGNRSLRTYRKGMPIPFTKDCIKLEKIGNDLFFNWVKLELEGKKEQIIFGFTLGKDRSNNRFILEKILSGEYKFGDSEIQIKGKKIFLLLAVKLPSEKVRILNPDLVVGVDLGIKIPAFASLSKGLNSVALGSLDDFLRVRTRIQSQIRKTQRSVKITNGGHGRKHKLKALNRFSNKERNFVKTYNHNISRKIIDFALENDAGQINLEFLEGFSKWEKNSFVLRNWSYFELQTMIEQKAGKHGIIVKKVDPYHTSQTCSECGHYEPGQREKQAEFICKNPDCKNFNKKINADKNASKMIAKSTKYVTKKSECEYHQKNVL